MIKHVNAVNTTICRAAAREIACSFGERCCSGSVLGIEMRPLLGDRLLGMLYF